jgi:hypothetical protein
MNMIRTWRVWDKKCFQERDWERRYTERVARDRDSESHDKCEYGESGESWPNVVGDAPCLKSS